MIVVAVVVTAASIATVSAFVVILHIATALLVLCFLEYIGRYQLG